jgi:hypothetical protein
VSWVALFGALALGWVLLWALGWSRGFDPIGSDGPAHAMTRSPCEHGRWQPCNLDMGFANVAQAGRSVPVKWWLTAASGAPVTDEASFVGLFPYRVSCTHLTVDPSDAIEVYASGRSGLQNLGNGYWQ